MGFREIKAEEKAQAVLEVLRGAKIIAVASKYGVSRDSLSDWVKRVKEQTPEWLEPYKRGPKQRKPHTDLNLKKIEKLNQLLARHQAMISRLEEKLKRIKEAEREEEPRPAKCDRCGCEKVYKDGRYLIKPKRFFDLLRRREKPILIPRFACAHCGHCLYLEEDRVLFFPGQSQPGN